MDIGNQYKLRRTQEKKFRPLYTDSDKLLKSNDSSEQIESMKLYDSSPESKERKSDSLLSDAYS